MKKIKIIAPPKESRLDKFLALKLGNGHTRNQLQKIIRSGGILVNGEKAAPHYSLKGGDVITVKETGIGEGGEAGIQDSELGDKDGGKKERVKSVTGARDWKVIEETPEYIVIDKPAGISVHGAPHMDETTLVDQLINDYPEIKKIGADPERPGIVHRLDKDVSGLMVIARTQASFENLAGQFKDRSIEKKYIALVYGQIAKESDVIDFNIERSTQGFKMAAKPKSQTGRRALTEFKVIKKFINYTLLEVKIITGRTHQIRTHLLAYGHPIVGDSLYSTARTRINNRKHSLGRIFLVSTELAFTDLEGERKKFKISLPENLNMFLRKVK